MARRVSMGGAAGVAVLFVCVFTAAGQSGEEAQTSTSVAVAPDEAQPTLDPLAFFERLAARYRELAAYEDVTHVVQVTTRRGNDPHRFETRIACKIENAALRIETPGSQVREGVGLDVPITKSPAMEALVLRYNLWLAPHMVLRFTDEPLKDFRLGVKEGFTPTTAEHVTVEKKPFVRLELASGDAASEDREATFALFVDTNSMLIERIEGAQRLPDGAEYETTLQITPVLAEPASQPRSTD